MQSSRGDCRLRVFPSMERPGSVDSRERIQASKYPFFIGFGRGLLYQIKMLQPWFVFSCWAAALWQIFVYSHSGRILCMIGIPDLFLSDFCDALRCFPEFLGRRCRRMASRGAFVHRGAVVVDGLGAAEARGAETWRMKSPTHGVDLVMQLKKAIEIPISRSTSEPNLRQFICFKKMLLCQRRDLAALARVAPPNEVPAWSVLVARAR